MKQKGGVIYTCKKFKFTRNIRDMDTKLTLSMDKKIIEEAKKYARKRNTSLSNLIENYLISVTNKSTQTGEEVTPLVRSLSGVLKLSGRIDHKKKYSDYLASKYR